MSDSAESGGEDRHEAEVSGTMSASHLEMGDVVYDVEKELRDLVKKVDGPVEVSVKMEVSEHE